MRDALPYDASRDRVVLITSHHLLLDLIRTRKALEVLDGTVETTVTLKRLGFVPRSSRVEIMDGNRSE